jgi:hypothetical protein
MSSMPASAYPGHGRPFVDVHGHIEGNRRLVRERLDALLSGLAARPKTAAEITPEVYGEPLTESNANWLLAETLCFMRHLEEQGQVAAESDHGVERWHLAR